jgi:hypothetical protein
MKILFVEGSNRYLLARALQGRQHSRTGTGINASRPRQHAKNDVQSGCQPIMSKLIETKQVK